MHTVDMGVCGWVVGNILWEIVVEEGAFGSTGSRNQQLDLAYQAYRSYCAEHGISVVSSVWTTQKLNKSTASSFPFMKDKASESKQMVPFVFSLASSNNSGSQHDLWRTSVIWALREYYTDIGQGGRYLSELELAALQSHILTLLQCYNALNVESQTAQVASSDIQVYISRLLIRSISIDHV